MKESFTPFDRTKRKFDLLLEEQLSDIIKEKEIRDLKRKVDNDSRQVLTRFNSFPPYGSYCYGGSIPFSQMVVHPTQIHQASDVHKTYPYTIPAKLPMFNSLTLRNEERS